MDSASAANQPSGPAIVWKSGGRTELPSTNPALNQYGTPYAMNSHGLVAGSAWSKANSAHATLWTPHGDSYTATDLGTLEGAAYSRATSVNGDGDVAGISDTKEMGNGCPSGNSDDDRDHAFLYQHGQLQYLGSLSHVMDISQAWGINAAEQIVGGSAFGDCSSNPTAMFHAFLWHHGAMIDLGTLASPSYQSRADAINDSGDIVGYSDVNAQQLEHAFLYTGGKMLDLNSLIDPADPLRPYVTLSEATAINCTGDIAALGWDSRDNSRQHGYLVVREGEDRHDQCTN
jgi:probable HAF family extracellular repeat protein